MDFAEIWHETDESPLRRLMEDPYDLIEEAGKDQGESKLRRMVVRLSVGVAVAAAVVLVVLSAFYLSGMFKPDMYLASGEHSKGYFELPDGSEVWLNQGSSLFVPKGMG